ncbi:MAG: hypothetical protein ACJ0DI_07255 [bacterium]
MLPEEYRSSPQRHLIRVDFPAPLGPIRVRISPSLTPHRNVVDDVHRGTVSRTKIPDFKQFSIRR